MIVSFLNLPNLPNDIEKQILELATKCLIKENPVGEASYTSQVLPEEIQQKLNQLYQTYFNQKVFGIFNKMENSDVTKSCQVFPHCDRERKTAINYFILSGGDNVITTLYKEHRKDNSTVNNGGENAPAEHLTVDLEYQFLEKQWHCYNVQKFHGVKNIMSTRLLFALVLEDNLDYDSFKLRYSDLISNGI